MRPRSTFQHARVVFLTAPLRRISCYGGAYRRSWHDYFTAHGDRGEAVEENIDEADLAAASAAVAARVEAERRRTPHVWVLGESQGGCTALDVATATAAPAIVIYAQRYMATRRRRCGAPRVWSFHGGDDRVICPDLAIPSLPAGARVRVARGYTHASTGAALSRFLRDAIRELSSLASPRDGSLDFFCPAAQGKCARSW